MPRCFMAKKLKYPYEQWKAEQNSKSRSPSPNQTVKTEEDHKGKWCSMFRMVFKKYILNDKKSFMLWRKNRIRKFIWERFEKTLKLRLEI